MVEVYNRNVVSNFKYTIKAGTIFMSKIVLKRLNDHKLLFRKLEKDLKYYNRFFLKSFILCAQQPACERTLILKNFKSLYSIKDLQISIFH